MSTSTCISMSATAPTMDIRRVLELTEQYRLGGRVVVVHMAQAVADAAGGKRGDGAPARRCRDRGDGAAGDVFDGPRPRSRRPRGVADDQPSARARRHLLVVERNNILNPATPYGDCSLIRIANLHANILQVVGAARLRELFLMLSEHSARLLNLKDYGLEVGKPADIVVIDAATPEQAVAEIRPPLAVWKRGRRTVTRPHPPELLSPA